MRIAVLVKQIPKFEEMELGPDGRLVRDGIELEMNPYCRRAVAQGGRARGRARRDACTVVHARSARRRGHAARGDRVGTRARRRHRRRARHRRRVRRLRHARDRRGARRRAARTTARSTSCSSGRNSVDADTGQVGPELAELLDLPFVTGVRHLALDGPAPRRRPLRARRRLGAGRGRAPGGAVDARSGCATRARSTPTVAPRCPPARIRRVDRGRPRRRARGARPPARRRSGRCGSIEPCARATLRARRAARRAGARGGRHPRASAARSTRHSTTRPTSAPSPTVPDARTAPRPRPGRRGRRRARPRARRPASCSARPRASPRRSAARRSRSTRRRPDPAIARRVGRRRASVAPATAHNVEEDVAAAVASWARAEHAVGDPRAEHRVGTRGRGARRGRGSAPASPATRSTSSVDDGRLVAWKPAFGGQLVAAIGATSPIQMATVRAGMLPRLAPRDRRARP